MYGNIKERKNISIWLIAISAIFILLGTYSSLFSLLALVLCAGMIVFCSEEDSLMLLFFIMPFANIFKLSPSSQSFFTYLILFYVLYGFFTKMRINFNFLIAIVIFVIYLVFQFNFSFDILRTIKFVANILFIYFALNTQSKLDAKKVYLSYVLGVISSSLIAVLNLIPNLESYVAQKTLGNAYDDIERFAGLYSDPNYYSINLIIALCLIVILNHKKQIGKVPAFLLSALSVYFAVITYSKSSLLMLALPLILFLYSVIKQRKHFIMLVCLIIVPVIVIQFFSGEIGFLNVVFSRFNDADNIAELTTGRSEIWGYYMEHFMEYPAKAVLGNGFGASLIKGHAAHNTYIDIVYYLGLLGFVLLCGVFYTLSQILTKNKNKNLINYGIVLCVLIMYFFLSQLFYFDMPFHILLAILVLNTPIEKKKINTRTQRYEKIQKNIF